jgi:hypothetical protein
MAFGGTPRKAKVLEDIPVRGGEPAGTAGQLQSRIELGQRYVPPLEEAPGGCVCSFKSLSVAFSGDLLNNYNLGSERW